MCTNYTSGFQVQINAVQITVVVILQFNPNCQALRVLASSLSLSAVFNVFVLDIMETTSFCFDHDSCNAQPDVNNFQSKTCFISDQSKHVEAEGEHSIRQLSSSQTRAQQ